MSISKRVHVVALLAAIAATVVGVRGQVDPAPILVVLTNAGDNPYDTLLPEILRAEGIASFDTIQLANFDASDLDEVELVVLAETPLTGDQVTTLTNYVSNGGRLVAMRPNAQLDGLLGISRPPLAPVTDGYLLVNQSGPGAGLQNITLPFKGQADQYNLAGGTAVANLYTTRTLSANRPAVVKFGRTAAWSFNLARSTAYVRQGDPAYAGLDRDGFVCEAMPCYRTNDIFFQTIDLQRVGVPHADVQMRLFSRVIANLLADSGPLPRLWYFPGASRTMLIPTGDSHTSNPVPYAALIAAVESVGARISLYLSRYINLSGSPVATWVANGHEVAVHPYFQPDGLTGNFAAGYAVSFNWFTGPSSGVPVPPGPTVRHHSLEWGGWVDPVSVMVARGLRMDLSYYPWGPAMNNPTQATQAHGYITGSGLPMRFVTTTGQVLPVYQQVTALADEQLVTGVYSQGLTPDQALAVSRQLIDDSQAGGYSAIATQFHVDAYMFSEVRPWVDGTLSYSASQQVPMWTAARWLRFVEARAATRIDNPSWDSGTGQLSLGLTIPAGSDPQSLTLPQSFGGRVFAVLTVDGQTVAPTLQAVNGLDTQFFGIAPLGGGGQRQVVAHYVAPGGLRTLSIGDVSAPEGNAGSAVANLTVTLSAASASEVTVEFATSGGSATAGADYTATSGTVTFPAGSTSRPVPVTILGDPVHEGNETVLVTLSSPVGAFLVNATGVVTITNDDPEPVVSIASTSATEGPGVSAAFTVSLSRPSWATVSATYTTAGGTAISGLDFTAGTGSVSFAPGVTAQVVNVPVVNDALDEDDEAFTVALSAPVNGTLGTATGTGTIVDDDAPPALSVTGVTVAEGDSGTGNAVFPVTLSAASSKTVSVAFATGAGTATTGVDFVAASGPLTFAPGEVSKVVNVAVVGDVLNEAAETFTVTLSAPSSATIATPQATGTITDNDPLPVAVADTYATPFGVPLVVAAPGVLTNDTNTHGGTMSAQLVSGVAHGTLALGANGSVNYAPAAGYAGTDSFVYRVVDASGTGNSVSVAITIATAPQPVADVYTTPFQTTLTLAAPGVLGNDGVVLTGVTAQLVTNVAHGTLTLAANGGLTYTPDAGFAGDDMFTYRTQNAGGMSVPATVTITVTEAADIQAPQELRVSSIEGNVVTFRWKAPSVGPDPTGYVLEGGLLPSQTLATLDAGHAVPIYTVAAPPGSFFVRVRALGPGGPSGVSNEILIHVTTAVAPSAPTALQATVADTTLHLAWTPTFQGGPGTGAVLDVTGAVATSLPLPAVERISFAGVAAGTYTLQVRTTNTGGSSSASAPVVITVPGTCAAAPQPPANLLAYTDGGTTHLVWDPPATGEAPTSYQISVSGIGVLPTALRAVSGALPAGTYTIEVRSVGACGASLPVTQIVTVP